MTATRPNPGLLPSTTSSNASANSNQSAQTASPVQFPSLEGGTLRLNDFRGRVVLLNFWATWSAPSVSEVPVLDELQKALGPRGLVVIGISYDDTAEAVRQFQTEVPQNYQIGLGGREATGEFIASYLPMTYLIDRRGRARNRISGLQSRAALEAAIEPLLNEKP